MLTHIWGLMSPDVGRTENQKHKQYKLVLKSSELDPSLLPRLLCFRSSQCWAAPVGAPSVAREWLWGSHIWLHSCTASCPSAPALCFWGRGLKSAVFWLEGSAGQGPVSPFHLQRVWLCQGDSGPVSLQAGWWRFWCERAWKSTCPYSGYHLHHMQNMSRKPVLWEPALAQGYYLGGNKAESKLCAARELNTPMHRAFGHMENRQTKINHSPVV